MIDAYRMMHARWTMILHDQASAVFASQIFRELGEVKVPAWMYHVSGVHASERDMMRDGLNSAALVCVVVASDATLQEPWMESVLCEAEKQDLEVIVCCKPGINLHQPLVGKEQVAMYADMAKGLHESAFADFVRVVTQPGRVKAVGRKVNTVEYTRERRLSGSEDSEEKTILHNNKLVKASSVSRDPSSSASSSGGIEDVFITDCNLKPGMAHKYATLLREDFSDFFDGTDDCIVHYTSEEMIKLGVHEKHARIIVNEVKRRRMERQGKGDLSIFCRTSVLWPQDVRHKLFSMKCIAVMNKLDPKQCQTNLQLILEQYVTGLKQDQHVYISHCKHDYSQEIFNQVHLYLTTKGCDVFHPHNSKTLSNDSTPSMSMKAAKVVIACLSPEFFQSQLCLLDVTSALQEGVTVVPVFSSDHCANVQVENWSQGNFL